MSAPTGQETTEGGGAGTETTDDVSWDSLRSAWETASLTPAQIQGRLEASRKWEQRAKAAPSGDELTSLREKAARADALDADLATDTQRAAQEARDAAAAEADGRYQPMLVETAFAIAIGDRKTSEEIAEFLADRNLSRFLVDGKVDAAKVLTEAQNFAPATGTTTTTTPAKGPTVTGVGTVTRTAQPGDAGMAAARSRGFVKD